MYVFTIQNNCSYTFSLNTAGPVVESTMTLTLLHTRDVGPNVHFRLSFNISLGLPSRMICTRDSMLLKLGRGFVSGVNYEVIRPLYVSTSQPEITRISFEEAQIKSAASYSCTVYVEGRTNINASATSYNFDQLGSATSTAMIDGECKSGTTLLNCTVHYYSALPLSCTQPH